MSSEIDKFVAHSNNIEYENGISVHDAIVGGGSVIPGPTGPTGETGPQGDTIRTFNIYKFSTSADVAPNVPSLCTWNVVENKLEGLTNGWNDSNVSGTGYVWMSSAAFTNKDGSQLGNWSTPIRISGLNGKNGEDSDGAQYIYALAKDVNASIAYDNTAAFFDDVELHGSSNAVNGDVSTVWYDRAQAISPEMKVEYVMYRMKPKGSSDWSIYSSPIIWAHWGSDGTDGDGVEYIFLATKNANIEGGKFKFPVSEEFPLPNNSWPYDHPEAPWSDEPHDVNEEYKYEWVSIRKERNGVLENWSEPKLWAKYSKDGENGSDGVNGRGIANIEISYAKSANGVEAPDDSEFGPNIPDVGAGMYLWTKMVYTYTEGTPETFYTVTRWGIDGSGESAITLDLTNERAEINADASGNILPSAVKPICTATLRYGTKTVSDAKYSISTVAEHVSIDETTGVLTFEDNFTFADTSVAISVTGTGTVNEKSVSMTKVMTVYKRLPAADGAPATSYWLVLSDDAVKVDKKGNVTPSKITASAMMQYADSQPTSVPAGIAAISYRYDNDAEVDYTEGINVDTTHDLLTVILRINGVQRDIETIPILRDGIGLQGAIIRGPRNWDDICSEEVEFESGDVENDERFLDVVVRKDESDNLIYYYCKTSYTHVANAEFEEDKWEPGNSFEFIATNILLAKNAKIKFLSGNEITVSDKDGKVSGGLRAAAAENEVVFWAGGKEPLKANDFYVTEKGELVAKNAQITGAIYATSGTIGGVVISNNTIDPSSGTYVLNADGSGSLASGNISWDTNGDLTLKAVHSKDYVQGTSGWAIDEEGNAEFNNATIRGYYS